MVLENLDRIVEDSHRHVPNFFCPLDYKAMVVNFGKKLDPIMKLSDLPRVVQDRVGAMLNKLKLFGERNRVKMIQILSKKAIKSLKVDGQDSSKKDKCPVCKKNKLVVEMMQTECKHKFCLDCIWKCSMVDKKCPICRKKIQRYPHFKSTEFPHGMR